MQELCNSSSWATGKTPYQEKNTYFVPTSILYRTEPGPERVKIPGLKRVEVEFTSKSQEVQRQTHANISNIKQSAENTEFNKRNRNSSL